MTPKIEAHLKFGQNEYRFILAPTASVKLMLKDEQTLYSGSSGGWQVHGGGGVESQLKSWKDKELS